MRKIIQCIKCLAPILYAYLWSMAGMVIVISNGTIKSVPDVLVGISIPLSFIVVQSMVKLGETELFQSSDLQKGR